jgi:hypothetical protein
LGSRVSSAVPPRIIVGDLAARDRRYAGDVTTAAAYSTRQLARCLRA